MFNETDEEMTHTETDPLVAGQARFSTSSSSIDLTKAPSESRTVQEVLNEQGFSLVHACYILALGTIAMSDSMQVAFVAIVLPLIKCEWSMTPTMQGFTTSIIFAGTGIGAMVIGNLSDRFGRKTIALITSIILCSSMVATSFAQSAWFFLVFGTIGGFCCGGSTAVAYTLWAEVSPEQHRSNGVMAISLMWNGGLFLSNFIGYFVLNNVGWNMYVVMMALPSLVPIFLLILLPESPKFLNSKNQLESLYSSMRKITSLPEQDLRKITFTKEEDEDELDNGGFLVTCYSIFSPAHRVDTFKAIALYMCLQFLFKGLPFLLTVMISTDYCNMGSPLVGTESSEAGDCAALSDKDLTNGMVLSVALFLSTISAVVVANRIGNFLTLKLLAIGALISFSLLLMCMGKTTMYGVTFLGIFFISGIGIIMFIILPQMYPTVSRNSGFGLVDGIGKLAASTAIFLLTALLNYSIRYSTGLFIFVAFIQVGFSFILSYKSEDKDFAEVPAMTG